MTADGKYTNAVYGFLAILFKILEDLNPDYLAVAFDLRAPTFRHKKYDGYKANRNQALIDLANKTAEQAIKIERNIHLDPMNAYERRIIHTTIQERDDVTTESTGEGEKRHVVVKPIFKK